MVKKTLLIVFGIISALVIITIIIFTINRYLVGAESNNNDTLACKININKESAQEKVKDLPEIKEYLKQFENGGAIIEVDQETTNYYIVHAYEIVKEEGDLPSHTATFNWYIVDKCNGQILSSMFEYDKNGEFSGYNSDYDKFLND